MCNRIKYQVYTIVFVYFSNIILVILFILNQRMLQVYDR